MRSEWMTGLRRIQVLAQAEVLHVLRDKATLAQIIVMPLIQLLVLANAATFTIKDSPAYIVDQDRSSSSRGLITRLAASGFFRLVGQSSSMEPAEDRLLRGEVTLVVTIPHDFESDLVRTGTGTVQLALNGEKGSAAGIVQGYTIQIMNAYARELDREIRPSIRNVVSGEPGPVPGRCAILPGSMQPARWIRASIPAPALPMAASLASCGRAARGCWPVVISII